MFETYRSHCIDHRTSGEGASQAHCGRKIFRNFSPKKVKEVCLFPDIEGTKVFDNEEVSTLVSSTPEEGCFCLECGAVT